MTDGGYSADLRVGEKISTDKIIEIMNGNLETCKINMIIYSQSGNRILHVKDLSFKDIQDIANNVE